MDTNPNTQPLPSVPLTKEEQSTALAAATKINSLFDRQKRLYYIVAICAANISLLRECNDHRKARGYAPLKTHDVDASKIG
jgi:hypothetical protein